MRRGSEQTPESEKARIAVRAFSSKRSTYRNGCCVKSDFIRLLRVANKSAKNLSFPLHIAHASFGSIRRYVPTARWMDHVAQAHGLGRTGVGGVVNPESATARLTSSCGQERPGQSNLQC